MAHCNYVSGSRDDAGLLRNIGHAGDEAIGGFQNMPYGKRGGSPASFSASDNRTPIRYPLGPVCSPEIAMRRPSSARALAKRALRSNQPPILAPETVRLKFQPFLLQCETWALKSEETSHARHVPHTGKNHVYRMAQEKRGGLVRVASVATEKSHDRRGISDLNVTESPRTTRVSAHLSGHAFSAREGDAPAGLMTPDFGLGNLVVWPAA